MSDTDDAIRQHLESAQAELEAAQAEITAALKLLEEETDGETIVVGPDEDLLAVLAEAPAGATVAIHPGYVGTLDWWSIDKPVTLTSTVPPPPGRITPWALPGPVLRGFLTITAADVTLRGVRCEGPHADGTLITTGEHTTLDRCVLLGSPSGQHRGVAVNSADVTIESCHIGGIWKDIDTQAITGWDGTKNLLVRDCYLEASGENILFGGADAASEAHQPQDIHIVDCTLFKPLAWRDDPGACCKNLFELKNAVRVTMQRCVLEHCWQDGQDGYAIVLTVRNQDGHNPWATIRDVLIEDCTTKHTGAGIQVLGRDDTHPSVPMRNVTLRRVTLEDIDPATFGGAGRQLHINAGPVDFHLEACTWSGAHLNTALSFGNATCACTGFVYVDCCAHEGEYGIHGDDAPGLGRCVLDMYCPDGYVWERNTIFDDNADRRIDYPPGTTVLPVF